MSVFLFLNTSKIDCLCEFSSNNSSHQIVIIGNGLAGLTVVNLFQTKL